MFRPPYQWLPSTRTTTTSITPQAASGKTSTLPSSHRNTKQQTSGISAYCLAST